MDLFGYDLGDMSWAKDLIGPLLNASVSTYGQISGEDYKSDLQKEQWAREDKQRAQDTLLNLQLQQIKAMYGGGGGSPGNQAAMTQAQKLAAMQNARNSKIGVLQKLMETYAGFGR